MTPFFCMAGAHQHCSLDHLEQCDYCKWAEQEERDRVLIDTALADECKRLHREDR